MCIVPGVNSGVAKVEGVFSLEERSHTHLPYLGDRCQLAQSHNTYTNSEVRVQMIIASIVYNRLSRQIVARKNFPPLRLL